MVSISVNISKFLVNVSEKSKIQTFRKAGILIGRSKKCDIVIPDFLRSFSNKHLLIGHTTKGWFLKSIGSKTGCVLMRRIQPKGKFSFVKRFFQRNTFRAINIGREKSFHIKIGDIINLSINSEGKNIGMNLTVIGLKS